MVLLFLLFGFGINYSYSQNDPKAKIILDEVSNKVKSFNGVTGDFTIKSITSKGKNNGSKSGNISIKGQKYILKQGNTEIICDAVKIYIENNVVMTRETITCIEAKLPKNDFIRIHRSFIVSIDKIDSFTNEFVEVNKKAITISRSYKKDVLLRLENV